MRKFLIGALLIVPAIALAQPPKKPLKKETPPPAGAEIVADTLIEKGDTTKVQYRVWMNGEGYESYLARVNGFLVRKYKVGKYTTTQPVISYYDTKWKELRPEDLEMELTKQIK